MKHPTPDCTWLTAIETIDIDGAFEGRTGEVEALLVVLSGCYDLVAGGGSWPARGVREDPAAGKPVALFLPPKTSFALTAGSGRILLASGRQPEQEEAAGEAMVKKPLLAMSGSQKAFDPASGEWKNQEMFPSSPQALLPRHIEETVGDGVTLRRVFPASFKALSLSLDELVLDAGAATTPPAADIPKYPEERVLYFDAPAGITVAGTAHSGEGCVRIAEDASIVAGEGRAYLAVVAAGPKE